MNTKDKAKLINIKPIVQVWIDDIRDILCLTSDKDVFIQAIREYHKVLLPHKHNYFESSLADRKIRSDRGSTKAIKDKKPEIKLTGDTHFCNTEGTIITRLEDFEGQDTIYVDYPVIDKINSDIELVNNSTEIIEWRTESMQLFKRSFIWGDLEEIDYVNSMDMIKTEVIKVKNSLNK